MAVSQNVARLRALLQKYQVDNVKDIGLDRYRLKSESVDAGRDYTSGGDPSPTSLNPNTPVSLVTTTAGSGSVSLGAAAETGMVKHVILTTRGSSRKLTLSCSVKAGSGAGQQPFTASVLSQQTGISLFWDGQNWNMMMTGSQLVPD